MVAHCSEAVSVVLETITAPVELCAHHSDWLPCIPGQRPHDNTEPEVALHQAAS